MEQIQIPTERGENAHDVTHSELFFLHLLAFPFLMKCEGCSNKDVLSRMTPFLSGCISRDLTEPPISLSKGEHERGVEALNILSAVGAGTR